MYIANAVSVSQHQGPDWNCPSRDPNLDGAGNCHSDSSPICLHLVNSLSSDELVALRRYCGYRLARAGLNTQSAEDLVQDCMLAVLTGTECATLGRHPLNQHIESKSAFILYLKGVLNSLVEARRRRQEHSYAHVAMHEGDLTGDNFHELQIVGPVRPENDVFLRDFFREFFQVLRRKAPKHLQPLVEAWEPQCLTAERIPLANGWRRHRSELRGLSRAVLAELE